MWKYILKQTLVMLLVVNTAALGFPPFALAAPIGTEVLIQLEQRQERIDRIQAGLAREDVKGMLVEMGVNPIDAQERVAALTDDELLSLDQQMNDLPAGGSVLAVLGVVLVVLIVLELVGVTNVFTRI